MLDAIAESSFANTRFFGHAEWTCPSHAVLQASTILIISLGGRIPQIMLNIRRGNSGELSPVTSGLNLAGNLARTFTTLVLTQVNCTCNYEIFD